jgi:threonine dehydrogenase-like Zn-dependent dehydrogenase
MPKSIRFIRSVPRFLLVRAFSTKWPSIASGALSCIQLGETAPPAFPAPDWVRIKTKLSGICGSDLSAIGCKGSPYFSPFVSTPFVLGHELVGEIVETGNAVPARWKNGTRVVIEPALCCEVRGISPPCPACAAGHYAHCQNVVRGTIKSGIQSGYCASTGGGWSDATMVAHHSQLHEVPPSLSNEEAVLAEPLACAVHAALKAPRDPDATILLIGCGSIGLMTLFAYRASGGKGKLLGAARYAHQADMAKKLGATDIFRGRGFEELYKWTLERCENQDKQIYRPELGKPVLLGGVETVIDCVGSSDSIDDAMRLARPRGTIILCGMPGIPKGIDWTALWYKELRLLGAYAYGWEEKWSEVGGQKSEVNARDPEKIKTMQLALDYLTASNGALKALVNRKHKLDDYRTALNGAFKAGQSGALKTVFEI